MSRGARVSTLGNAGVDTDAEAEVLDGDLILPALPDHVDFVGELSDRGPTFGDVSDNVVDPSTYFLSGVLRVDALECAVEGVLARHEALRAVFRTDRDEVVQVIHARPEVRLELHEVAIGRDLAGARTAAVQLVKRWNQTPYNLIHGPLVRAILVRLSPTEHVFALAFHHALVDDVSLRVVFDDVWQLYALHVRGSAPQLPPLRLRYADWVRGQSEWLAAAEAARRREYWRSALAATGASPHVELSGAKRRATATRAADVVIATFAADDAAAVRIAAQTLRATVFSVLAATLAITLSRFSTTSPIPFWTSVTRRSSHNEDDVVGLLTTEAVVSFSVDGAATFSDVVRAAALGMLDTLEHVLPLPLVREAVGGERVDGATGVWLNVAGLDRVTERNVAGLRVVPARMLDFGTKQEVDCVVFNVLFEHDGLDFTVIYPRDVLDDDTASALLRCFQDVLRYACADPLAEARTFGAGDAPGRDEPWPVRLPRG